ncbi:MAG: hypothetical protein AB8G26_12485 [Ilumatobacter sp.]
MRRLLRAALAFVVAVAAHPGKRAGGTTREIAIAGRAAVPANFDVVGAP